MWRSSIALTLPLCAFALPADAEPVLLAKLERPKPAVRAPTPPPRAVPIETRVRMHVAAVVRSDAGPVVLLRDTTERRVMPIWIGPAEALAIQRQLDGVQLPRPMTHDLLVRMLEQLDAKVVDVEVTALVGDTFIGTAHLRARGQALAIDARPSDLIALAVRTGAPILVNPEVLAAAELEPQDRVAPGAEP